MWAFEATLATVKTGANGSHDSDDDRYNIDTKKYNRYKIGDIGHHK